MIARTLFRNLTRAPQRNSSNARAKHSIRARLLHSQLLSAPWLMLMAALLGCAAVAEPSPERTYAYQTIAPITAPPLEVSEEDVRVLAATAWAEARSEGEDGMRAVAHVIVNRVGPRFGDSVEEVALSPYQFSAWNRGDPNRPLAMNPDRYARGGVNRVTWLAAQEIAREVLEGRSVDPTRGALFYHTRAVRPYWAKYGIGKRIIGAHVFYEDVPDLRPRRGVRSRTQSVRHVAQREGAPARRGPRAGRVNGVIQYAPAPSSAPAREPPPAPPLPPRTTTSDAIDPVGSI